MENSLFPKDFSSSKKLMGVPFRVKVAARLFESSSRLRSAKIYLSVICTILDFLKLLK